LAIARAIFKVYRQSFRNFTNREALKNSTRVR
jgi:hypothetical protein